MDDEMAQVRLYYASTRFDEKRLMYGYLPNAHRPRVGVGLTATRSPFVYFAFLNDGILFTMCYNNNKLNVST